MQIPFFSFEQSNKRIKKEILEAFEDFFDSNWYILGNRLAVFEKEYAEFSNTNYCLGISNGLDALHIALKALNIGNGDEVIVPSNTYIATALAVSYVGAKPIFVEPDLATYNLDPSQIAGAITRKTKAIIPVHLYGQPAAMDQITHIANQCQIAVIEDNAQAHGATYQHKITGSWGTINATSFYPGKNLGALGDAGAITTDNEILAEKVSMLRNYGSQKKYFHEIIGHNMRLDECQAAMLSVKLKHLKRFTEDRQQIAQYYIQNLAQVKELALPHVDPNATHVYHQFVIRTDKRDALQTFLNDKGIGTMIHYPIPPHLQKAYSELGFSRGDFPIAETLAATSLSLPIWPGINEDDLNTITTSIKSFYGY